MDRHLYPLLFVLLIWWFSTGLIIYLDGLPRRTFKWSLLGGTLLMLAALWGLAATKNDTSVAGAYLAFTWGTLAWGWQELSFYMGYVTGPRRAPCPETCGGLRHFGHAIQTSLYHELAIIVASLTVIALTAGGANRVGLWTFLILWWMHQSAKLNVFFGVRNLQEQFLPEHLLFLRSFLTRKPMNAFFPFSVTASTVVAVLLFVQALAPDVDAFESVGFTLLGVLMALAILEHWLLVIPISNRIWNWSLKSHRRIRPADVEVVAGFLGAGKTTFLRRLLAGADPAVRTVVLVNDFGAVGVDGSLLSGQGAEVVELPNGCICCSLRNDLGRQIREVVARWSPQRLLIEPSGVAEVATLVSVLSRPDLADAVRQIKVFTLIDAASFLGDYARLPAYFAAQANIAPVLIVNKADLVSAADLLTVEQTLHSLNPAARIITAEYGVIAGDVPPVSQLVKATPGDDDRHPRHGVGLGLETWSAALPGTYSDAALRALMDGAAKGEFGDVVRIKGIARLAHGWVHFDLAGKRTSVIAFAPGKDERGRVVAIGRRLDTAGLERGLAACRSEIGNSPSAMESTL
ncbi:MAG: putative photosynthetic complex assembly protein PuhE [Rhodocyclaceae bacterium]